MANELKLIDQLGTQVEIGKIEFENYDIVSDTLKAITSTYDKPLVFNEESYKEAKDLKTKLNSLAKSVDNLRKKDKEIYLEPLTEYENKMKKLKEIVDEKKSVIEIAMNDQKLQWIKDSQKEEVEGIPENVKVSFELSEYNRASSKDGVYKKTAEIVKAAIDKQAYADKQAKLIKDYCSMAGLEAAAYEYMLKDGTSADEVITRIREQQEELKRREEQEKAEREKEKEIEVLDFEEVEEPEEKQEVDHSVRHNESAEAFNVSQEVVKYKFEMRATRSEATALVNFLIANGYDFDWE